MFENTMKMGTISVPPWTDIQNEFIDATSKLPNNSTSLQEYQIQFNEVMDTNPEYIPLFTDGSYRKTEGCDSAFVLKQKGANLTQSTTTTLLR